MNTKHRFVLALSYTVITLEITVAVTFRDAIFQWLMQNLWVVVIPFAKSIFKRVAALKMLAFIKSSMLLIWHAMKLLFLKLIKTLGIRYGVFFSQYRWRRIRYAKVMFLRRGRQLFRRLRIFWSEYTRWDQWIILIAFFPIVLVLFLLGMSFNVTRKTIVQKSQEVAIFNMAASTSEHNNKLRAWISKMDRMTLEKIRALTTDKTKTN